MAAGTTTNLTAGQISADAIALVAGNNDTVNFTLFTPYIEITTDGAALMYVTVDGSTPTVGGANTYVMPASASTRTIRLGPSRGMNPKIGLISAGTPTYWVTAVQSPQTP